MKKGFTLVEVCIMLAIIGIVFAITVPAVISKSSQGSLIEQAKKTAAILNQAIYNSIITSGEVNSWYWQGPDAMENILHDNVKPRLNTGHECTDNSDSFCYYPIKKIDGTEDYLDSFETKARVVLNDGAVIGFGDNNVLGDAYPSCTWSADPYTICAIIFVDVNGNKKPNVVGKDVYFYGLHMNGSVLPYGATKSSEEIDEGCKDGAIGYTCAAKLAKDGWEACATSPCTNPYPFSF